MRISIQSLLFTGFICCICAASYSQDAIFIDERNAVDKNRYSEIKGDPYYFDKWPKSIIFNEKMEEIKGVEVNLNGYTGLVEVRKGERIIELDPDFVAKVICPAKESTLTLAQGRQFQSQFPFVISHYEGGAYQLVEEFFVKIGEKTFNNYGENTKVERFTSKSVYVLVIDGLRNEIKLKKKDFLEILYDKEMAETVIKNEKLKMKDLVDYITLLSLLNQ